MFTGIIEEIGTLKAIKKGPKSAALTIHAKKVLDHTKLGDSISTDGVCLTVVKLDHDTFTVDVMNETIKRSNIDMLKVGSRLNLERALRASDRLGGHIVSGHIDGTGVIVEKTPLDIATIIRVNTSKHLLKYMIKKGSIAIDGISLTLVSVDDQGFTVSLIPYTKNDTTLADKNIGDTVNLECDIIGKYVEKLLKTDDGHPLTFEKLKDYGF